MRRWRGERALTRILAGRPCALAVKRANSRTLHPWRSSWLGAVQVACANRGLSERLFDVDRPVVTMCHGCAITQRAPCRARSDDPFGSDHAQLNASDAS
jgi:hypothetical protein